MWLSPASDRSERASSDPGEDGAQKGRLVPVEQLCHVVLHGPGGPGRPPTGRAGRALAVDSILSPLVGQQEHSLGGEVGDGVLPEPGGVLEFRLGRHRLARPEVQQVLPAVVDHLAQGGPLQLHRHLGTVVRGDGVLQQGHGGGPRPAGQAHQRIPDGIAVQPVPPQGQRQARADQQRPLPPETRQQQGKAGRGKAARRQGKQMLRRQQVLGQIDAQGEGGREGRQPPHLVLAGG